jgi:hypothetical protein
VNREEGFSRRIRDSNRWGDAYIRENKLDGQGKNSCRGEVDTVAYKNLNKENDMKRTGKR